MRDKILNFQMHEGFKRYAANYSWLMAEKILRILLGLFVGVWVARYLGPNKFGLLSYAQSFVLLFIAISSFGLEGIVVREIVKDESREEEILGSAFGLRLLGSLLLLPILWFAVQVTDNDNQTNLLIFIIALSAIFQSFNVIDFYCQAKVQSKYVAWANAICLAVTSIIKIILILYKAPLVTFALVMLFDAIILALGLLSFYIGALKSKLFKWRFRVKTAKILFKDSWYLILSGLVVSIYMRIDQIMIKQMLGSDAVGQYAAAVKLSEAWYFIPTIIAGSVFPAIINAKIKDQDIYIQRLRRLYTFMIWLGISVALIITLLSSWLVQLLYGEAYGQAAEVLMIHIWSGVFVFLSFASGKWLLSENLQIYSMINTLVGAIVCIILNYFLISSIGVVGAAVSTIFSYGVAAYLMLAVFKETRPNFLLLTRSLNLIGTINAEMKMRKKTNKANMN